MDEGKRITKKLDKKDFVHKDAIRALRTWTVHHTDYGGHVSSDYTFHVFADGHVTISENDGDGFIFLEKEAFDLLVGLTKK